jgi:hypothetical protein
MACRWDGFNDSSKIGTFVPTALEKDYSHMIVKMKPDNFNKNPKHLETNGQARPFALIAKTLTVR